MKTKQLKAQIQSLINQIAIIRNDSFQLQNQLYKKLEQIKELELLENLPKEYLTAYLLYKQAFYSNYCPENLKPLDKEIYLEKLSKEISIIEEVIQKPNAEPNNEKLLALLGERIATGEIKRDWEQDEYGDGGAYTLWIGKGENGKFGYIEKGTATLVVDLKTGEIEPDQVKEFLDKHGLNKEGKG